jgi:hypothetical protein
LEVGEAIFVKSFDPNGRLVLGIRLRSFLDASPFEIYFPTLERFDEALLAEKRLLSMIQKIKGLPT